MLFSIPSVEDSDMSDEEKYAHRTKSKISSIICILVYIISILLYNILFVFTDFCSKYQVTKMLKAGGFGAVYSGYRKSDTLPVSIQSLFTLVLTKC